MECTLYLRHNLCKLIVNMIFHYSNTIIELTGLNFIAIILDFTHHKFKIFLYRFYFDLNKEKSRNFFLITIISQRRFINSS